MHTNCLKGGLPFFEHYYPTDKQIKEITREEIITLPGLWNPSSLDDAPDALQKRIRQVLSIPFEFTDSFYNMEGDIIVRKTNIDNNSITSNNSRTISGSKPIILTVN